MTDPVIHNFVIEGSQTVFWEYGNKQGRPLILIHGFRGDHHGLEGLAKLLPEYRVLVPDLPGFGASDRLHVSHTLETLAQWLQSFVSEVVVGEPFALLGHSFGSLVVAKAIQNGLAPVALSLINPISTPALEGPRAILTKLAIAYYRVGAALPERLADALLRSPFIVRVMSEAMAKTHDRELRRWIHRQHAQFFSGYTDRYSLLESFTASVSHTVGEYSASLTMPTQIIVGEVDDITPLEEQVRFAATLPGSELRVMKQTGHLIHYEATIETVAHIEEFLSRKAVWSSPT